MAFNLNNETGREQATRWLAVSVLVSGVLQVLMLWPSLRDVGFRFDLRAPTMSAATRRMMMMSIPVALSAGVLQVSVLLDNLAFVNDIVYNPHNGRLAFTDRGADPGIWEVNPDGTGLTKILDNGPLPERLAVLPAPSALALLGLSTLVAARRRR